MGGDLKGTAGAVDEGLGLDPEEVGGGVVDEDDALIGRDHHHRVQGHDAIGERRDDGAQELVFELEQPGERARTR